MPVLRHPCGRDRRLYLAMVYRDHGWQVAGVYGSAGAAQRECAKALGQVIS
ncbi:MAG: hypothetical protein IT437_10905 [Phycisphaerales bacterium]|nr:hypothetical protein [Phycisphaerales bacterium]